MKEEQMVRVDCSLLENFMVDVLVAAGVPVEDAAVCADVLIASDKRGIDSHGVSRLKPIYYDRIRQGIINPVTQVEVVREQMAVAVVDGHNGMGQVVGKRCMQMAIDKAKEYGMGMVAVRNSNHYGIAGYYTIMAAEQNMIGITGTNARPSVAPTFGVEAMLGTNPLTFGMPSGEAFPFVLDCATSTTQRGKIEVYGRLNKELPPGWVIGEDGQERTDTLAILDDLVKGSAALAPLGGLFEETGSHKGYGYAAVVEILSAALQGGSFLRALSGISPQGDKQQYNLGHFFIAINVEAFTDLASFKQTVHEILEDLRQSKKAAGVERIFTAGEKEYLAEQERTKLGVPVNENLQQELLALQQELGLAQYKFPF